MLLYENQGTSIKKGVRLKRIVDLLAESTLLPLTLTSECRALRIAVTGASDWLQKHASVLLALDIPCDLTQTDVTAAAEQLKADMMEHDNDEDVAGDNDEQPHATTTTTTTTVPTDNNMDIVTPSPAAAVLPPATVTMTELEAVLEAADLISYLDFPELKAVRLRVTRVRAWFDHVSV